MSAIPAASQDREILSLFRRWIEAHRATDRVSQAGVADAEHNAASAVWGAIEDRIFETPAEGTVGFAVKAYLLAYYENPGGRVAALDRFDPGDGSPTAACAVSLLRDAARIVPEIAELAARAINPPEYGGNIVRLRPRRGG